MRITLRVEFTNNETTDVVCSAKDLVAFEDKYQRSVARLETEMRLTDLLWIAWHSLHRQKQTGKDFDNWLDDVESISSSDDDPKSKGLEIAVSTGT
jgi:hypothetical protein